MERICNNYKHTKQSKAVVFYLRWAVVRPRKNLQWLLFILKSVKKELTTRLKKIDKKRSEIDKNIHCIGTLNVILTSVSVGYRMNCLKSTAPDFLG